MTNNEIEKFEKSRTFHQKTFEGHLQRLGALSTLQDVLKAEQYAWLNRIHRSIRGAVHPAGLAEKVEAAGQLVGWAMAELKARGFRNKQIALTLGVTNQWVRHLCNMELGRRANMRAQLTLGFFEKRPWEI